MASRLDSLQGRFARKLGRIIEVTRFLDVINGDRDFEGRVLGPSEALGGQIYYVVDTNVVQAFIQPFQYRRYSRLFHDARLWAATSEKEHDYENLCDLVSAKATLLATEHLFSIATCRGHGKIYMRRSHQAELERQVAELGREFKAHSPLSYAKQLNQHNRAIKKIAAESELDRASATSILLEANLFVGVGRDALDRLNDREFGRVYENYVASAICGAIATDNLVEPLEQIRRLNSDEFWHRFYPIDWEFPVKVDAKDEREWHDRLLVEFAKRPKRSADPAPSPSVFSPRRERKEESLAADAKSLAHLCAVARTLGPRERLVFVTGDRLMLNAYRRWYAEKGEGMTYLLRPLSLYSPEFQGGDQTSSEQRVLFERMRQTLEAWTYPLTIAIRDHYFKRPNEQAQRLASARARDWFCLDAEEGIIANDLMEQFLVLSENEPALENEIDKLDGMATAMRWLERLSIGASKELAKERVRRAARRAKEFIDKLEEQPGGEATLERVVLEWLNQKFEEAMATGFSFSLPLAQRWIERLEERRAKRLKSDDASESAKATPRVPVELRVRFPYGAERLSVTRWLDKFGREGRPIECLTDLTRQPALLFILASWIAYRDNLLSDAIRFADFAARLDTLLKPDDEDMHDDCLYLKAVSLRIRIASVAPSRAHEADVWLRDLEGAEEALALSLSKPRGNLRRYRAHSERASVRLTYCEWVAVGEIGRLPAYKRSRLDVRDIFRGAVEDLEICNAALEDLRGELARPARDEEEQAAKEGTFSQLEMQTRLGPECALIVYASLISSDDNYWNEAFLPAMPTLKQHLESMPSERTARTPLGDHPMIQAYEISAAARRGEDVKKRAKALAQVPVELPLDKAMIANILKGLGVEVA